MRKLLHLFITAIILLAMLAWPVMAQELPDLSTIDSEVAGWLPEVQDYQYNYYLLRGRYYQMFWSHTEAPDHAIPAGPDHLGTGPNDQNETGYDLWLTAGLPVSTTYRIKIDTYRGFVGAGWVLIIETGHQGDVWQRAINQGPESHRVYNWRLIPETPLP